MTLSLSGDWDCGEQPSCAQVLRGCVRVHESVCEACAAFSEARARALAHTHRGALGAYSADSEESNPKSLRRRSVPAPGTATQPAIHYGRRRLARSLLARSRRSAVSRLPQSLLRRGAARNPAATKRSAAVRCSAMRCGMPWGTLTNAEVVSVSSASSSALSGACRNLHQWPWL